MQPTSSPVFLRLAPDDANIAPGSSHDHRLAKFEGAVLKRSEWLNTWNTRHVTIITSLTTHMPPTLQWGESGGSCKSMSLVGARVCCTEDTIFVRTLTRAFRLRPSPEGPSRLEWMRQFAAALNWNGDRGNELRSASMAPKAAEEGRVASRLITEATSCASRQRRGGPKYEFCVFHGGNTIESF